MYRNWLLDTIYNLNLYLIKNFLRIFYIFQRQHYQRYFLYHFLQNNFSSHPCNILFSRLCHLIYSSLNIILSNLNKICVDIYYWHIKYQIPILDPYKFHIWLIKLILTNYNYLLHFELNIHSRILFILLDHHRINKIYHNSTH